MGDGKSSTSLPEKQNMKIWIRYFLNSRVVEERNATASPTVTATLRAHFFRISNFLVFCSLFREIVVFLLYLLPWGFLSE